MTSTPDEILASPLNHVLVVDDDADVRQVVCWALEDAGFEVEGVAEGRAAVAHALRKRPSLVVLDMGLPGEDGSAVARRLREVCGETLPVLVVTADGMAAQKAQRAGAYAYLHKPFHDFELIEAVQLGLGPG